MKKVAFLGFMAEVVKSANTGALMLDSCIMRYTYYSDQEREDLLWYFFNRILPDEKDTKRTKFKRIVRNNNKQNKNAGYKAFAKYLAVDPVKLRDVFSWIGEVPENDQDYTKTHTNFLDNALNIKSLMVEIFQN